MWYLAELLFAEPADAAREDCLCERSNIVVRADNARAAYDRACSLGESRGSEPGATMLFLGVSHLTTIGELLEDGTEISGDYSIELSVWGRISELIPKPDTLKAVAWESEQDIPLKDSMTPDQVRLLKRAFGEEA